MHIKRHICVRPDWLMDLKPRMSQSYLVVSWGEMTMAGKKKHDSASLSTVYCFRPVCQAGPLQTRPQTEENNNPVERNIVLHSKMKIIAATENWRRTRQGDVKCDLATEQSRKRHSTLKTTHHSSHVPHWGPLSYSPEINPDFIFMVTSQCRWRERRTSVI